ncbi:MerR family transcriptional regulator [Paenibacillus septentrionalis]|uniref:MerR family transcriptional regulator n=1 Tax=Paenibacillus septentrionalis TaxID=429342 RepID=A0ABW1V7R4_9BACL
MNIKQVADLAKISVRTLHHYDEIGLLIPDHVTESGYRQYSENNLQTLQHILFFKELGFSLKEIRRILHSPDFDTFEALHLQRRSLLAKREQLDKMIATIDRTIANVKGENQMSIEEKFDGLQWDHNPYEQEAREKWGDQAVDDSNQRIGKLSKEQKTEIEQQWQEIYTSFAARIGTPVDSEETMALTKRWYELLNQFGSYSYDAFIGLGQMYVLDERFTKNIDRYGEGLAQYLSEAMAYWGELQKKNA